MTKQDSTRTAERLRELLDYDPAMGVLDKEAAEAYDNAAIRFYGEFAVTNKMRGLL